jgi:hypothetical protein
MYFCLFHVNNDQFNEKFVLPTILSDQGDSDKEMQISHKQHTLFFCDQTRERKPKKKKEGERDWTR